MQTTNVNAPNKNISPLPVGRYAKLTNLWTQSHQQATEGKSGLEAENVWAIRTLRSFQYKMKIAVEKLCEMHNLSNDKRDKWIEDYVETETAGGRNGVEDAEAAFQKTQENMNHAEAARLTRREPKKTYDEMHFATIDRLCDLASSDSMEDEDDVDEEIGQGIMSEDDETGWLMGTITTTIQQCMARFRQKKIMLHKLTWPGWEDAADYVRVQDTIYGSSTLRIQAVIQPHMNENIPAPPPITFAELLQCLDIASRISQMPQETSWQGWSHIRLG